MKWNICLALSLLSLCAFAHELKDLESIPVHKTGVKGLQHDERLLIRTDIINKRNGKIFQHGYYIVCADNDRILFNAQIFPYAHEEEHYEYEATYSLCHSIEDATKDTDNQCEVLSSIQVHAFKNIDNKVSVDLPQYTLDLGAYTGQDSPCLYRK